MKTLTITVAALSLLACVVPADELPPIHSVVTDERGRFVVNGELFFPILMYSPALDDDSLRMFHEHGFNALSLGNGQLAEKLRAAGMYAAVHAGKPVPEESLPGVFMAIGMDSPALNWKDAWREKLPPHTEKVRANAPGRPVMCAIGYWGPEDLESLMAGSVLGADMYEDLIGAIEVAAPYLYPIPYQPVGTVADAVKRARVATAGTKPLLPVLQLYRWKADDRYPTPAELRCMAYLALIHGATGIGYYSYSTVTGEKGTNVAAVEPELWASVKPLNEQIRRVGLFLIDSQPGESVTLREPLPGVHFRAARKGDQIMLVLVNAGEEPQTVHLAGSTQGAVTLQPLEARVIER